MKKKTRGFITRTSKYAVKGTVKGVRKNIGKGTKVLLRNQNVAAGHIVKNGRKNARQIIDNTNVAAGHVIKRLSEPLFDKWHAFVAIFLYVAGLILAALLFYQLAEAGTVGFVVPDDTAPLVPITDDSGNVLTYNYPTVINHAWIWFLAAMSGIVLPATYLAIRAGWLKLRKSSS